MKPGKAVEFASTPMIEPVNPARVVETDLRAVEEKLTGLLDSHEGLISEICHYLIDGGGKRLRPTFILLVYRACGGGDDRVADPIDAFFLQIQGSGRITMADGGVMRVGYAGKNGHIYTAIGRELVKRGVMTPEQVSMQSLRAWLKANPAEAEALMNANRSYVFFREIPGAKPDEGPRGAQNVALTPGRSLAVDRKFVPLGVPVWLDAADPDKSGPDKGGPPLRRLLIAQDTGGAIRGPVRGDVFWGWGDEAAERAGAMRDRGEYYILLPLPAAERVLAQPTS